MMMVWYVADIQRIIDFNGSKYILRWLIMCLPTLSLIVVMCCSCIFLFFILFYFFELVMHMQIIGNYFLPMVFFNIYLSTAVS